MSDPQAYMVGWICAVTPEYVAARAFLDEEHERPRKIGSHKVVVAGLPDGEYGTTSAAVVARDMLYSFPNVRIGLMVGIGGGAPGEKHDIRLGDIIVSSPGGGKGGVFYTLRSLYKIKGHQLVNNVNKKLEKIKKRSKYRRPALTSDRLYRSDVEEDNPAIYYGLIASRNQLMKDARIRDKLAAERGVLCFKIEAAGLINHFLCLVIRGICDYSDLHKNKEWQGFAAIMAAAYTKDLLLEIPLNGVKAEKPILEVLNTIEEGLHGLKQTADETKMAVETMHSDHTILFLGLQQGVQDLKLGKAEDLSIARNPHFIEIQYTRPRIRFALVGLGGFSIFWVRSSTKATFKESYRSIADALALPRRYDPSVNVLALVRDWLQKKDVSPWLIIIDNVDDVKILFSKIDKQNDTPMLIASYLPKSNNGKILFTSRSWDAAEKLTGNSNTIFRVPTIDEAQALLLLQKKLGPDINEAVALRLVHTLNHIPLAVNQAAAYIHRRSPRVTVKSYLDEFKRSKKRKDTLLRSDRGDIRRYDGVSNSVIITWQITFKQIKREQPRAANLLSLISYFYAQNIPEYILHNYNSSFADKEDSDDDNDNDDDDGDFKDDLHML
ncbi:putative kinesin [Colletotrichum incanum]|nr:putative kinesin [Colletotrichum incanum]